MDRDDAVPRRWPRACWSVLATFPSRIEAEIVVGLLKGEGIDTRVSADYGAGMHPQLQLTNGVRLLVAREDAFEAREILNAVEEAGDLPDDFRPDEE